jgi:hypothetical protein
MTDGRGKRVAVVVRGDPATRRTPSKLTARLDPLLAALEDVGLAAELAIYADDVADQVRAQLLGVDAALVWVDPVTGTSDRATLDAILRDVSERGVFVSAHPDTILRMGTKQVLYDTRDLGWGCDTRLYQSADDLVARLPDALISGPRVLKQYRGNGGIGVHKIEIAERGPIDDATLVHIQHARVRDASTEVTSFAEFMARCAKYFDYAEGTGRVIDQPFQPRIVEGMIRCYFVRNEVVGFARQYPPDLGEDAGRAFGLASDKTMYSPDEPAFARLRRDAQTDWVPDMQQRVGVADSELPIVWDADFLFGPKTASGDDTYVLCEINVSAVFPMPPEALPRLAAATVAALDE